MIFEYLNEKNSAWAYSIKWIQGGKFKLQVCFLLKQKICYDGHFLREKHEKECGSCLIRGPN